MKNSIFLFAIVLISTFAIAQVDSSAIRGKFSYSSGTNTSSFPHTIGLGDIDGDGSTDVVVTNSGSNSISIFRNITLNGNFFGLSCFAAKIDLTTLAVPMQACIVDVDNDNKPDIGVTCYGADYIHIFPGTGKGSPLTFGTRIDIKGSSNPSYLAFADLDGDSKPDMIVSNFGSGDVSVFRNTSSPGSISFASKINYSTGNGSAMIAMTDINGDSKMDIVVTDYNANAFSVLINTSFSGTINFNPAVNITAYSLPNGINAGDLNNDGKPDVVISNSAAGTISVFRNNSTLSTVSFDTPAVMTSGSTSQEIAIVDIDHDSITDICVANRGANTISVFIRKPGMTTITPASFFPKVDFPVSGNPLSIFASDMDNNGSQDLVVSNYTSGAITVMVNKKSFPHTGLLDMAASDNNFSPFPNPATNDLFVIYNGVNLPETKIVITDMFGRTIQESYIIPESDKIRIPVSELQNGAYLLTLTSGEDVSRMKFLKN